MKRLSSPTSLLLIVLSVITLFSLLLVLVPAAKPSASPNTGGARFDQEMSAAERERLKEEILRALKNQDQDKKKVDVSAEGEEEQKKLDNGEKDWVEMGDVDRQVILGSDQDSSSSNKMSNNNPPIHPPTTFEDITIDYKHLIGQSVKNLSPNDLPRLHRVLPPGAMMTMDYRPERLNVHVNNEKDLIITRLSQG
ncbi:hypothetical protein HDV05_003686 [Chytridiales sp. JEL 0842]|nr:hypothetical protein HDV05_003686 [Chytridiales sp. JEL 0842]